MTMRAGDVEFRQTRVLVGWGGLGEERRGDDVLVSPRYLFLR